MFSVQTQETKKSTTCEGVSFTIRKLSRIQRSLRDLPIFEQRLKADECSSRFWELTAQKEKAEKQGTVAPELTAQIASADYEFSLYLVGYLYPASIRAGLVSIDGLEINGQPATPELLVTCATPDLDELVREIYSECEVASGLTVPQQKNLPSPITSNEPVVSEETSSIAVPASA